jgi:hypothetical protein
MEEGERCVEVKQMPKEISVRKTALSDKKEPNKLEGGETCNGSRADVKVKTMFW